jgi:hypothetical protein
MKVVIRLCPAFGSAPVVECIDKTSLTVQTSSITFDAVFSSECAQEDFFILSGVKEMIDLALKGFSVTVFAFGQTGAGKTYTITGKNLALKYTDLGLVPRSLGYIFTNLSRDVVRIQASYLEIYNEHVLDLLNPKNESLPIRWTQERGFFVEGLFVVHCSTLEDALVVLEQGVRNRTTAAHNMNEHSSRSHSMLTIYIETELFEKKWIKRFGKITFVDLAGSERVKESVI